MYFTSGSDRAFEQLMQTRPGADHFDNGEAGSPEDCGTCRFYRPDWKYQYCVYAECPYQQGKLTALPPEQLTRWMAQADMVLLEADGAKRMPCKVPAAHEPVLLPESDIVLAVAGLSALGRPLREVCFRLEQACALLGTAPETLLTPELLARLLASEQGGRKLVGDRRFSVVLNQADAPARIAAGEQTLALLRKKYEVQGVLTYFDERERA